MGGVFISNNSNYAIFPLELIVNKKYQKLTSNEKIIYTLLLNRKNLSHKNRKLFSDDKGVFIYYSNSQLQKQLNCTQPTITLSLNNLEQAGLIHKEYQDKGRSLKIYVNDIRGENDSINSGLKQPQDKFSYKPYSFSNYKEKPVTNHFEGIERRGNTEGEKPLTQAQINRRTFGDKKNNRHSHKENSNSASQEKQVSFDVEKAEKLLGDGTIDFGSMKIKKRRTRNTGPTSL